MSLKQTDGNLLHKSGKTVTKQAAVLQLNPLVQLDSRDLVHGQKDLHLSESQMIPIFRMRGHTNKLDATACNKVTRRKTMT